MLKSRRVPHSVGTQGRANRISHSGLSAMRPVQQTGPRVWFSSGHRLFRAATHHLLAVDAFDHPAPDRFALTQPRGLVHAVPMARQVVRRLGVTASTPRGLAPSQHSRLRMRRRCCNRRPPATFEPLSYRSFCRPVVAEACAGNSVRYWSRGRRPGFPVGLRKPYCREVRFHSSPSPRTVRFVASVIPGNSASACLASPKSSAVSIAARTTADRGLGQSTLLTNPRKWREDQADARRMRRPLRRPTAVGVDRTDVDLRPVPTAAGNFSPTARCSAWFSRRKTAASTWQSGGRFRRRPSRRFRASRSPARGRTLPRDRSPQRPTRDGASSRRRPRPETRRRGKCDKPVIPARAIFGSGRACDRDRRPLLRVR